MTDRSTGAHKCPVRLNELCLPDLPSPQPHSGNKFLIQSRPFVSACKNACEKRDLSEEEIRHISDVDFLNEVRKTLETEENETIGQPGDQGDQGADGCVEEKGRRGPSGPYSNMCRRLPQEGDEETEERQVFIRRRLKNPPITDYQLQYPTGTFDDTPAILQNFRFPTPFVQLARAPPFNLPSFHPDRGFIDAGEMSMGIENPYPQTILVSFFWAITGTVAGTVASDQVQGYRYPNPLVPGTEIERVWLGIDDDGSQIFDETGRASFQLKTGESFSVFQSRTQPDQNILGRLSFAIYQLRITDLDGNPLEGDDFTGPFAFTNVENPGHWIITRSLDRQDFPEDGSSSTVEFFEQTTPFLIDIQTPYRMKTIEMTNDRGVSDSPRLVFDAKPYSQLIEVDLEWLSFDYDGSLQAPPFDYLVRDQRYSGFFGYDVEKEQAEKTFYPGVNVTIFHPTDGLYQTKTVAIEVPAGSELFLYANFENYESLGEIQTNPTRTFIKGIRITDVSGETYQVEWQTFLNFMNRPSCPEQPTVDFTEYFGPDGWTVIQKENGEFPVTAVSFTPPETEPKTTMTISSGVNGPLFPRNEIHPRDVVLQVDRGTPFVKEDLSLESKLSVAPPDFPQEITPPCVILQGEKTFLSNQRWGVPEGFVSIAIVNPFEGKEMKCRFDAKADGRAWGYFQGFGGERYEGVVVDNQEFPITTQSDTNYLYEVNNLEFIIPPGVRFGFFQRWRGPAFEQFQVGNDALWGPGILQIKNLMTVVGEDEETIEGFTGALALENWTKTFNQAPHSFIEEYSSHPFVDYQTSPFLSTPPRIALPVATTDREMTLSVDWHAFNRPLTEEPMTRIIQGFTEEMAEENWRKRLINSTDDDFILFYPNPTLENPVQLTISGSQTDGNILNLGNSVRIANPFLDTCPIKVSFHYRFQTMLPQIMSFGYRIDDGFQSIVGFGAENESPIPGSFEKSGDVEFVVPTGSTFELFLQMDFEVSSLTSVDISDFQVELTMDQIRCPTLTPALFSERLRPELRSTEKIVDPLDGPQQTKENLAFFVEKNEKLNFWAQSEPIVQQGAIFVPNPFSTDHPYLPGSFFSKTFTQPGATQMKIRFTAFGVFDSFFPFDEVLVKNEIGTVVFRWTGQRVPFNSPWILGSSVTIELLGASLFIGDRYGFDLGGYFYNTGPILEDLPRPNQFSTRTTFRNIQEVILEREIGSGVLVKNPYDCPLQMSFHYEYFSPDGPYFCPFIYCVDDGLLVDIVGRETGYFQKESTQVSGEFQIALEPDQRLKMGISFNENGEVPTTVTITDFRVEF